MSQTPQLFHDTVVKNITLGDPRPDRNRMLAVAAEAGVDSFIPDRPHGYEAVLEERGQDLSVGQRQRVTFARALYKATPVLLLDEPTSALDDPHAARVLQVCRARADAGQLVVVATHRRDFRRLADRVVEVREGEIRECEEREERSLLH